MIDYGRGMIFPQSSYGIPWRDPADLPDDPREDEEDPERDPGAGVGPEDWAHRPEWGGVG